LPTLKRVYAGPDQAKRDDGSQGGTPHRRLLYEPFQDTIQPHRGA
jgi:hypothetical protein